MPFERKVAAVALLTLALIAPTAVAQEDGVTVDPDSPAGKEYALPIDQARRDAANGGGNASPGLPRPTPAFGVGVRPDFGPGRARGPRGGKQASTTSRSATSALAPTIASAQRAQEQAGIDRALSKASVGSAASEGSLVLLVGGVVVMVLGVAAGLFLRRRTT